MLRQTFCHIPGIGQDTERRLWENGCTDWQILIDHPNEFSVGAAGRDLAVREAEASLLALENRDHAYFRKRLGTEAWRAWPDFRDRCVYLDIETDGGRTGQAVTVVGLYDSDGFKCLIKGQNLDSFEKTMQPYGFIVTFFGTGFDLPMLSKRFKGYEFDQLHLDLCFGLKKLGFRGGLKKIEKELGISRGDDTDGLNGLDAIRLWNAYRMGSEEALEQLVAYNREDVVNLEHLAQVAYDGLKKKTLGSLVESA